VKIYQLRGIGLRRLLSWGGLYASGFYYKRSYSPKGIRSSTHSVNQDSELVENLAVVKDIEGVLSLEFLCYGYRNINGALKEMGWIINHKKIYRLMKESKLLYGSRIRGLPFKRNLIKFRSLKAERPLQYLSMDIKYVYMHGTGRNALLLTGMDVYSRKVLIHMVNKKRG